MYISKLSFYSVILIIFSSFITIFSREQYYESLEENNLDKINTQIETVSKLLSNEKEAFMGTILMKKSGFLKTPAAKLNMFKEGKIKLESAISKDSNNLEYRFLRLIIQENAPKFLGYNKDLTKDSQLIHKKINNINVILRKIIVNYAAKSKYLEFSK